MAKARRGLVGGTLCEAERSDASLPGLGGAPRIAMVGFVGPKMMSQAALEPPHLRAVDVEDHQLPGDALTDPDLRAQQVLWTYPVPGGQAAQQHPAIVAVQIEDE